MMDGGATMPRHMMTRMFLPAPPLPAGHCRTHTGTLPLAYFGGGGTIIAKG